VLQRAAQYSTSSTSPILDALSSIAPSQVHGLEVPDCIHGDFELSGRLVQLLHTAVVQRLGHLRQLGAAKHVFPCAEHTRLQHSLGVAHLASSQALRLRENQPELNITDSHVFALGAAGGHPMLLVPIVG
jgi:hypothetical protein